MYVEVGERAAEDRAGCSTGLKPSIFGTEVKVSGAEDVARDGVGRPYQHHESDLRHDVPRKQPRLVAHGNVCNSVRQGEERKVGFANKTSRGEGIGCKKRLCSFMARGRVV